MGRRAIAIAAAGVLVAGVLAATPAQAAAPTPVPAGPYLSGFNWAEPGAEIQIWAVGADCEPAELTINGTPQFLEPWGAGFPDWAEVTDYLVPTGVTGSGAIKVTCTPEGGVETDYSIPFTIATTAPASTYRGGFMYTTLVNEATGVLTVNKVGYLPGETVTLTAYDESQYVDSEDITTAMTTPVSVVPDGEGAITRQIPGRSGWDGFDRRVLIASQTSRLIYNTEWDDDPFAADGAALTVPATGTAGATVPLSGTGYAANESVAVALHSASAPAVVLATLTASPSGVISGDVAIPFATAPGAYRLWAGSKTGGYLLLNAPLAVSTGSSDAQPVYRFWSSTKKSHFYTLSETERDFIIDAYDDSEWSYEGPAYEAYSIAVPGAQPLFRFWSPRYQGHFFTASATEKDAVIANYPDDEWSYEGIAYYILPADAPGATPVARFWSAQNRHHFYTADAAEAEFVKNNYPSNVWAYEGTAFTVPGLG